MANTWSLAVNMAGVRPSNPMVFEEIKRGLYVGVVKDSDLKNKDGKMKIQLICELEGQHAGREIHAWINDLEKGFNKGALRAALLCKGVPLATLDGPGFNINQDTFKGAKLNLLIEPREAAADGTKPYPNVGIVAPEHVENVKQALAGGTSTAAAGAVPTTPAANGAASGMASAANAMGATITV